MKTISGTEKRFPREFFTKKLTKICERLDACHEVPIAWTHRYLNGIQHDEVTIQKVWVVGSYSRGSLNCGDLDLVFSYTSKAGRGAPYVEVIKQVFGRVQYTSFYSGTPEQNTSYVTFPDPVEIWSGPGCDWRKAIESIVPNPSAGRAARSSDVIPLRLTQLNADFESIDEIVELINQGVLESEFVPFSADMLEPLGDSYKQHQIESWDYPPLGAATKRVLPAAFRVIDQDDVYSQYETLERNEFRCGGSIIRVGRPYMPQLELFDDLSLKQVGMVPHLSSKGPNGVWFLRRGPNHPLVQAFANKKAYAMCAKGKPAYVYNSYADYSETLVSLYLCSNKEKGQEYLEDWDDGIEDESDKHTLIELSGKTLHDAISGFDFLEFEKESFALNQKASIIEEIDGAEAKEILAQLKDVDVDVAAKPRNRKSATTVDSPSP